MSTLRPYQQQLLNDVTKRCARCKLELHTDLFGKDKNRKDGKNKYCISCARIRAAEYRSKNPVAIKTANDKYYATHKLEENARLRKWRKDNPEKKAAERRAYREKYPDKYKAIGKAYYAANSDKMSQYGRTRYVKNKVRISAMNRAWRENNSGVVNAITAKRRAAQMNATPPWADLGKIRQVYVEARAITDATGVTHEVDHIVPLVNKHACGLHIAENLRIVPVTVNRAKSNKLDMALVYPT